MTTFTDLGVPENISNVLARDGITEAFPIQSLTISDVMAGRDLSGRAPAGSGKTLAFGAPLAALARKGASRRPSALVLVPTRELASQVAEVIRPMAGVRELRTATFYGGTSIGKDRQRLERGVDVAIACPGRLADLSQRGFIDLSEVRLVVVDEADRMADMGFLPEVKRLLDQTSKERQTLLFSATLDGDVDVLVKRYQRNPVRHELGEAPEEEGDVQHFFWETPAQERLGLTADIVHNAAPAIVFTRTKHAADRVAKQLGRRDVAAAAIHGDRSQNQRERALADFSAQRVTTLVATDVAARGIHVDNVEVVVHYDPAGTSKDYVHRSGRTGRAGADGLVVTLVAPDKTPDVHALQRKLGMRQGVESVRLADVAGGQPVEAAPAPAGGGDSSGQGGKPPRQGGKPSRQGGTPSQDNRPKAGSAPAKSRGPAGGNGGHSGKGGGRRSQ